MPPLRLSTIHRLEHQARLFSTTRPTLSTSTSPSTPSASQIGWAFLQKFQTAGPITTTQLLDANQLRLFSLTLNRPRLFTSPNSVDLTTTEPVSGTPLPPYYHLAYFTVPQLESRLGADGTDASYNPEPPFTRRMWAGGRVEWKKENPLLVGEEVSETTRVLDCNAKIVKKTGEEMLVVEVEKTFENKRGVSVVDNRNWVFRAAFDPNNPPKFAPAGPPSKEPVPEGENVKHFKQTVVQLFRFSGLTFNAHKIHYSLPWCREVEGHRGCVVHGPMNLINMLDFWRDSHGGAEGDGPTGIQYRATSPVYAEEEYVIVREEGGKMKLISAVDGTVCMKGEIQG